MGFDVGGSKGRLRPSMNVTPLVDVVLVLLIIFMVVTPLLTKQIWLNVPPKPEADAPPPPPDAVPPIVLTLTRAGFKVNGQAIDKAELGAKVQRMLNARADKVVFFDAQSDLPYADALEAIDFVRGAGVDTLAVLADEVAVPDETP
jgi:biopolymer transport protein TolR